MPWGSLINAAAVIAGSLFGLFIGKKYPENIRLIVMDGVGLASLFLGLSMALKSHDALIVIFSLLIGGVLGELLSLQKRLEHLTRRMGRNTEDAGLFSQGLLTAFLIFCMGSMTIVGAIEEGINGERSLLLTKSILDAFTSVALASTFGIGVLFSFVPLLLFQGGITLTASLSRGLFSDVLVANLTGTGGLMIIGLGLNILNIRQIKVLNYIPALLIAAAASLL
ncbi:MAG TPA: DUF554 domain-containing protein [Candidatus Mcinerneyibacteriales bacterium]|jgi:uncharacterized membrane protein YqgA involved in biofilm formation|nr:DUF554 domain-containing protein [Candidatus Mcinerneyibacteriales bacterium]HPE20291.1 DUF554 domain-containing protein [Candidatus Mcinerneyibacteriales bacterium]HPJ69373.1 DUF554 domain-containing protein [Candidatus Mcinerneyibacteriales bacterium]HPQ89286.1 DUF554 domain-containing protein [Candidatus Mcinerneyibacteriales bacterium]